MRINYIFNAIILFKLSLICGTEIYKDDPLQTTDKLVKFMDNDLYFVMQNEYKPSVTNVEIKVYYECLCGDCIKFYKYQFATAVAKLNQYLDIHTYPYGNAKTIVKNGQIDFECQHGPLECYGNKLHACAIEVLQNITTAVMFNACMMGPDKENNSNDQTADECAIKLRLDSEPIKKCAKGPRGTQLLKEYGDESKNANFMFVPYILINGKLNSGENFMKDVCNAFTSPPPPCL